MIYVENLGLTGNQMFSYAFARSLQLANNDSEPIVMEYWNSKESDFGCGLMQFNCCDNILVETQGGNRKLNLLQRAILHYYFNKKERVGLIDYTEELHEFEKKHAKLLSFFGVYCFTMNYYKYKKKNIFRNKLVLGYYESWKYFYEYDSVIRNEFTIPEERLSEKARLLIREICENDFSVAVGIRVQFTKIERRNTFSKWYIEQGLKRLAEERKIDSHQMMVFCFADEEENEEWIRANYALGDIKTRIVTSDGLTPAEKLLCMSKCRDFVIGPSTFEWWAQHLGSADDKLVVAPDIWKNKPSVLWRDIYEPGWIVLQGREDKDNKYCEYSYLNTKNH